MKDSRFYPRAPKKVSYKETGPGDITYISCILLPQTLDLKVISLSRGLWRRYLPFLLLLSFFQRRRKRKIREMYPVAGG